MLCFLSACATYVSLVSVLHLKLFLALAVLRQLNNAGNDVQF